MYYVCIDSGDEGVNGEEQDSEAASDKNWKCAPLTTQPAQKLQ